MGRTKSSKGGANSQGNFSLKAGLGPNQGCAIKCPAGFCHCYVTRTAYKTSVFPLFAPDCLSWLSYASSNILCWVLERGQKTCLTCLFSSQVFRMVFQELHLRNLSTSGPDFSDQILHFKPMLLKKIWWLWYCVFEGNVNILGQKAEWNRLKLSTNSSLLLPLILDWP